VRLVIAGPDGGAREPFIAQIRQASLENRVHLVGPLYGPDKLAALADATCFCLPSRQEGFSVAITEALACGVPAVISDACHFPEVAEQDAGLVTPLDPAQIAQALLQVLRDPSARSRMGAAGRALVQARYTWPQVARQMAESYQQAVLEPSLA
jgi:glycosyltransferase involved in cell wall biosynthesis